MAFLLSAHVKTMPSEEYIRGHFERLDAGDTEGFYNHVATHATFKITGHGNPLYGTYKSKDDFVKNYLGRLAPHFSEKITRKTTNVIVRGEYAIIEYTAYAKGKTTGTLYEAEIVWIAKYENNQIVHATTYMDTALVQSLFYLAADFVPAVRTVNDDTSRFLESSRLVFGHLYKLCSSSQLNGIIALPGLEDNCLDSFEEISLVCPATL